MQFSLIGSPETRAGVSNIILFVCSIHQSHKFGTISKNCGELRVSAHFGISKPHMGSN